MNLRTRVIIIYIIITLTIVILIGGVLPTALHEQNLDTISERSIDELQHIDFAISNFISEAKYDVQQLSLNEIVRTRDDSEFTTFLNASEDTFQYSYGETETEIIYIMQRYQSTHPYVNSVYMGRENGTFVRSYERQPTAYDPRVRPWYILAEENPGEVMVTDPYQSITTPDVNLGVVTALTDENGEVYGVVGADITLEQLTNYISTADIDHEGEDLLVDGNGIILESADPSLLFTDVSTILGDQTRTLLDTDEGVLLLNGSYLMYYTSPELGWKVGKIIPVSYINQQINESIQEVLVIVIIALILLSLITVMVFNYTIIRPISGLTEVSREITETGDLDQEIDTSSTGEIGTLEHSFKGMVEKIRKEKEGRKKAYEELQSTNRLLRAIRKVNKMIVSTNDLVTLFENTCNILVKEADYNGAWIIHFDKKGQVDLARDAGYNETFTDLLTTIGKGQNLASLKKLSDSKGKVIVTNPEKRDPDCPIERLCGDMTCMIAGMYEKERLVGVIVIFLKPGQEANEDEISLFTEIAGDVSFASTTITINREKREAELAKKQSEEKYSRLFNNASDSILLHEITSEGEPGKILEANDAASVSLGYTREELLQMSVSDIITPEDKENAPKILGKLMAEKHSIFESNFECKDGSVFPVEVSAHVYNIGNTLVILSICRDITERKEMEEQISTAISQIETNTEQLAILNDEIRNPLTVIVAYAEMAPEDIREKILSQSYEIDNIIAQLDKEWLKSEKIWEFLQRYYGMEHKEDDSTEMTSNQN